MRWFSRGAVRGQVVLERGMNIIPELMEYLESNGVEFNRFSSLSDINNWLVDLLADNVEIPESQPAYCETQKKIKKLRMKKVKKDMGDGRYIIYYDWTDK